MVQRRGGDLPPQSYPQKFDAAVTKPLRRCLRGVNVELESRLTETNVGRFHAACGGCFGAVLWDRSFIGTYPADVPS